MKKYIKELICLFLQLVMFYIFPLCAGPTDAMGMVVIILGTTLLFAMVLGTFSRNKVKYLYPIVVSILFLPSVFIYYNETALIHAIWYLVDSYIGLMFGTFIAYVFGLIKKKITKNSK